MNRFFLLSAAACGLLLCATLPASAAGKHRPSRPHGHLATSGTVVSSGGATSGGVVYEDGGVTSGGVVYEGGMAQGGYSMGGPYYYDPAWGMPLALVVPPRSQTEVGYAWGVGNTFIRPITAQFRPYYPGPYYYDGRAYRPTPCWPSHTDQFGVYYVRGPW